MRILAYEPLTSEKRGSARDSFFLPLDFVGKGYGFITSDFMQTVSVSIPLKKNLDILGSLGKNFMKWGEAPGFDYTH